MTQPSDLQVDAPRKLSRYNSGFSGRTLDSFADEIITRSTVDGRAVLDCGFFDQVSDPDFSPSGYGQDSAQAAQNCARAIRANAQGIGRRAPYGCLTGYDLQYRLMPHWARKEIMTDLGIDLRAAHVQARGAFGDWAFKSSWLEHVHLARHFEFFFILLQTDRKRLVDAGKLNVAAAIDNIIEEIEEEGESIHRGKINDDIRARVRERLETLLRV